MLKCLQGWNGTMKLGKLTLKKGKTQKRHFFPENNVIKR